MKKLNVVYMGSGPFGVPSLDHLLRRPDVRLTVVTQPDKPAGRGRSVRPTPVAAKVLPAVPLKKFQAVNDPAVIDELRTVGMDLLVVCDFGQILKPALLALPSVGPFNIHGSLLPAYRGAAPIQRAILNGAARTGVTFLRVNERCDAGPLVSQVETEVGAAENFGSLHERLSKLAVPLLETFLNQCVSGQMPTEHPQDDARATMAPKIKKEELHLMFDRPADDVLRRIRAFSPTPGSYALFNGHRIKVLEASVYRGDEHRTTRDEQPGLVRTSSDGRSLIAVCAGGGSSLALEKIQPEGGRVLTSGELMNGHPDIVGAVLR